MNRPALCIDVAAELRFFLPPRHRRGKLTVPYDQTSSLGHVIESIGIPLPEIGRLTIGDDTVPPAHRPAAGDTIHVHAPQRPQKLPIDPPRFLLDVHFGTLARRLRLIGIDASYGNDLDDDTLIALANAERRVLLTQDRRLLCRRQLWLGAHVRGSDPDEQLRDVLERFAPPLAPWTRCTSCNGLLTATGKGDVEHLLQAGTRHTYETYGQCETCGQVYWRGAHSAQLEAIIDEAARTLAAHH